MNNSVGQYSRCNVHDLKYKYYKYTYYRTKYYGISQHISKHDPSAFILALPSLFL